MHGKPRRECVIFFLVYIEIEYLSKEGDKMNERKGNGEVDTKEKLSLLNPYKKK